MVVVGAITRLTESGLSMTEWRPLIGALPPLSEIEWERVFDLYKQTPEFQKEHFWMGIDDFKNIFFWEWFHRLLGRTIGLVFAVPLAWFWIKGQIPKGYKLKLVGLLILGGMQGYMGWFMVQSGLVDEPSVSHYRLAAHLSLAFIIFALLLKTALSLMGKPKWPQVSKLLEAHLWIAFALYMITVIWGAFTAGQDAGLIYNDTFPKMGDTWLPYEMGLYTPYFVNFFENHAGIQFAHRWLAIITTFTVVGLWGHARALGSASAPMSALAGMVVIQALLGIATLMSVVALPLAVAHQAGALIMLGLFTLNIYQFKK